MFLYTGALVYQVQYTRGTNHKSNRSGEAAAVLPACLVEHEEVLALGERLKSVSYLVVLFTAVVPILIVRCTAVNM